MKPYNEGERLVNFFLFVIVVTMPSYAILRIMKSLQKYDDRSSDEIFFRIIIQKMQESNVPLW